jgi:hypothetical protein
MREVCLKEQNGGRVPPDIEFFLATIPDELQSRLQTARAVASKEVTREKIEQLPDDLVLAPSRDRAPKR